MIRLPPEITFEKRVLSQSSWSYEFRHNTLGVLGRILLQDLPDGRGTHLSYEVAGDPADPRTAERRAIFEPLGLEIARHMKEIAGPYSGPRPVAPPRPVEAAHGVESELMPCHSCSAFVAMPIFAPDAIDAGRFEDYARLMVPEYVRHDLPTWIIGPALGPGPRNPADILQVWPTRKPITRLTPKQFNPRIRRPATRHCRWGANPDGYRSERAATSMKRFRQPAADPIRKARFRETAREIVGKDRTDRKNGFAVDTAGAIARAMERAYRQGFADAQSDAPAVLVAVADTAEALEWALIPPRPRTAFWDICLFALGRGDTSDEAAYLVPAPTERDTPGWQLILKDQPTHDRVIGEKTIRPLLRLGLLESAGGAPERLVISTRGKATWRRFLERGGQFPEDLTSL